MESLNYWEVKSNEISRILLFKFKWCSGGKIGVNWVNVIAMVAFIGIGVVIGKLI